MKKIWAPGYTIFDLGVTHKTYFGENPCGIVPDCK